MAIQVVPGQGVTLLKLLEHERNKTKRAGKVG